MSVVGAILSGIGLYFTIKVVKDLKTIKEGYQRKGLIFESQATLKEEHSRLAASLKNDRRTPERIRPLVGQVQANLRTLIRRLRADDRSAIELVEKLMKVTNPQDLCDGLPGLDTELRNILTDDNWK